MTKPAIWSADTETYAFTSGNIAPRLVCSTWSHNLEKPFLLDRNDTYDHLVTVLDGSEPIAWYNAAFDASVIVSNWPHLFDKVYRAYEEGRMRCVLIREALYQLYMGQLKDHRGDLSLANTYARRTGKILEGKKGGEHDWRVRFGELEGVKVKDYPAEAVQYALQDATCAGEIFLQQQDLPDELNQTKAAFALYLMACTGIRANPRKVAALREKLEKRIALAQEVLIPTGILRPSGKRNMAVIKGMVASAYLAAGKSIPYVVPKGRKTPDPDKKPNVSYSAEVLKDLPCTDGECDDRLFQICGHPLHWLKSSTEDAGELSKYVKHLEHACRAPLNYTVTSLVATGRTAISNPPLQQLPQREGVRQCIEPPEGFYFVGADYSALELTTLGQILLDYFGESLLAASIQRGQDPHLMTAAMFLGVTYEEAAKRLKEEKSNTWVGDKPVSDMRQLGKCFHPDTEVLTKTGWKRIPELNSGEQVAAAIPRDGGEVGIEWQVPSQVYSRDFSGELVHLKNEGIDLRVTPDHRMIGYNMRGPKRGSKHISEPIEVVPEKMTGLRYWPNAGKKLGGVPVEDTRILMLAVATQADGSYSGRQIKFGFSKQRKIERLRSLLRDGEYVEGIASQGYTTFTVRRELTAKIQALLDDDKTFPWWWLGLSWEHRELVLEEVVYWDSHKASNWKMFSFSSTPNKNRDVLQALAHLTNRKTRQRDTELSVKDHHLTRGGNLEVAREPYVGKVVCLSVPSSYVLVRDGGIPVITGQCLNFGIPGGLSAPTFVHYAKGFGYKFRGKTEEEKIEKAREFIREYKNWYPEIKRYLDLVAKQVDHGGGYFDLVQPRSKRIRGQVGYTNGANCVDAETEALSKTRGWVKGFDLEVGEEILTKNRTSGAFEWQPIQRLHLYPDYDGPVVEMRSGCEFHAVTTPHHKWLTDDNEVITTMELVEMTRTETVFLPRRGDMGCQYVFADNMDEFDVNVPLPLDSTMQTVTRFGPCPVWCPQVENGNFAARRSGTTYVTMNSTFQGLAADLCKDAIWNITRECFTPGTALFGSRVVLFMHDEIILQSPKELAAGAGDRLSVLMLEAASRWCPDVPTKAEPWISLCWEKEARSVRDSDGKLLPWIPKE